MVAVPCGAQASVGETMPSGLSASAASIPTAQVGATTRVGSEAVIDSTVTVAVVGESALALAMALAWANGVGEWRWREPLCSVSERRPKAGPSCRA
jgi:hypothetical protein